MAGIYSFDTEARIYDFHFIPLGKQGVYVGPRKEFSFFFLSLFVQFNWEMELLTLVVAVVN